LEKDRFFEGEPIYYMLKLTDISEHAVWVSPFDLWSHQLAFQFYREPTGEMAPHGGLDAFTTYGEAMRGDSLAPGESFYNSSDLTHHGKMGRYTPWTGDYTLPAGEYRAGQGEPSAGAGATGGAGSSASGP
jgi:hypothetical protein